jgi:YD repeat-containing protein
LEHQHEVSCQYQSDLRLQAAGRSTDDLDQLNRIKGHNFRYFYLGAYNITNDYNEAQQYDPNGNLYNLLRYGQGGLDNVYPTYYANTNKLNSWTDGFSAPGFDKDVDSNAANNYVYDANGNLITDVQQQIAVQWTPYGKVKQVQKTAGQLTEFKYDASGNRVMKRRTSPAGLIQSSFYVRDASGNIMAEYEKVQQSGSPIELVLTERPIYGSDRIGVLTKPVEIDPTPDEFDPLQPNEIRLITTTQKSAFEGFN